MFRRRLANLTEAQKKQREDKRKEKEAADLAEAEKFLAAYRERLRQDQLKKSARSDAIRSRIAEKKAIADQLKGSRYEVKPKNVVTASKQSLADTLFKHKFEVEFARDYPQYDISTMSHDDIKRLREELDTVIARDGRTAFKNVDLKKEIVPSDSIKKKSILEIFGILKRVFIDTIRSAVDRFKDVKLRIDTNAYYEAIDRKDGGRIVMKSMSVDLTGKNLRITNMMTNEALFDMLRDYFIGILARSEAYEKLPGSNWSYVHTNHFFMFFYKQTPLQKLGGSWVDLPAEIKNTVSCINIQSYDNKCAMWSIIAGLFPEKSHPERVNVHNKPEKINSVNWECFNYPTVLKDFDTLEKNNQDISINVYTWSKNDGVSAVRLCKQEKPKHIDLLYYCHHYVLIKNFSRFMSHRTEHNGKKFFCKVCLHGFSSQKLLDEDRVRCNSNGVRADMPSEGSILDFKNMVKRQRAPFAVYADFESVLRPIMQADPSHKDKQGKDVSFTEKRQEHVPCGYMLNMVCLNGRTWERFYRGNNPEEIMTRFWVDMEALKDIADDLLTNYKPIVFAPTEYDRFYRSIDCYLCGLPFNHKVKSLNKVADHCHITGAYRGPAHNSCNVKLRNNRKLPVFFHNLRGYDSHHIMKYYYLKENSGESNINAISQNSEKFMMFSVANKGTETIRGSTYKFLDSFQFMAESLENLVKNLYNDKNEFKFLRKFTSFNGRPVDINDFMRKGVYPYSYFDSFERFNEVVFPPIEAFHNDLSDEACDPDDYEYAKKMFEKYCNNLGDYHDLYLRSDVYLLSDVFESFRDLCGKNYDGLDPTHYITSPNMAIDAALLKTGVKLELLHDKIMYDFCSAHVRGGVCFVSKRLAEANNKHMSTYDPAKPSSYIQYLDANNLYGWAMIQSLPTGNFKWLSDEEVAALDVMKVSDGSPIGYKLEVDVEYPKELHELHKDYPLLPENRAPIYDDLSDYQKAQRAADGVKDNILYKKLMPTLYNKTNYIIDYRLLKFAISQGLKVTKVHRVLSYNQSPWLKPYIDFNTSMRAASKSDFEKNFYKLMNNAVFGKLMEDVYKRVGSEIATNENRFQKIVNKAGFKRHITISENLAFCEVKKPNVKLDKPIYTGGSVLDLSKLLMGNFHYNVMKPAFGNNLELCYTDTDSLIYHIKTDDYFADIKNKGLEDHFDTSDYPKDHPLFSVKNKKVIGKFKDEACSNQVTKFVGLRPKMYSYVIDNDDHEHNKGKGVARSVVASYRTEMYEKVLMDSSKIYSTFKSLRSKNHNIFTIEQNKIGLSSYDDKRKWLDPINSVPFGYQA